LLLKTSVSAIAEPVAATPKHKTDAVVDFRIFMDNPLPGISGQPFGADLTTQAKAVGPTQMRVGRWTCTLGGQNHRVSIYVIPFFPSPRLPVTRTIGVVRISI